MRILKNSIPAGTLLPFVGGNVPAGFLLCDGSTVSRAIYASLFAAIGVSHGAGDGATTFHLPDYRGRFVRGADDMGTGAAGRDPDAASRTASNSGGNSGNAVGSVQSDAFKAHLHDIQGGTGGATNLTSRIPPMAGVTASDSSYDRWNAAKAQQNGVAHSGTETRPQNSAAKYIIKV